MSTPWHDSRLAHLQHIQQYFGKLWKRRELPDTFLPKIEGFFIHWTIRKSTPTFVGSNRLRLLMIHRFGGPNKKQLKEQTLTVWDKACFE